MNYLLYFTFALAIIGVILGFTNFLCKRTPKSPETYLKLCIQKDQTISDREREIKLQDGRIKDLLDLIKELRTKMCDMKNDIEVEKNRNVKVEGEVIKYETYYAKEDEDERSTTKCKYNQKGNVGSFLCQACLHHKQDLGNNSIICMYKANNQANVKKALDGM